MNASLKKRAKKAGIGIEERPCKACAGAGVVESVDGLDLLRVRQKAGVSGYRVAQMAGKRPSHVKMVEETDPEKQRRRCSDELLEVYLDIAENGVPEEHRVKPGRRSIGYAQGARNLRTRNYLRPPLPKVKKGQVWEKKGSGEDGEPFRVEVLHVEGKTALIRRFDDPEAIGRTMRPETLAQKWINVTEEVKG